MALLVWLVCVRERKGRRELGKEGERGGDLYVCVVYCIYVCVYVYMFNYFHLILVTVHSGTKASMG